MVSRITQLLVDFGAIEFGEFTLASGARSRYYIDIKTAATRPELLGPIGEEIAANNAFDVVAGVAVGAVPIAVATSLASRKPYAIIRQQEKGHGKSGAVIGNVSGKNVLLVEDVTTSGGSVIYGVEKLREAGATVQNVVTVVDREQGAADALKRIGIELRPLVRASEILSI
ncbi:MAG: orotate phosphoribosyltransferase [Methanoculleus sp. SDB]|nr:MAG: orotate phosphoribosyltransferase [Methanoculleus sp. SDB]